MDFTPNGSINYSELQSSQSSWESQHKHNQCTPHLCYGHYQKQTLVSSTGRKKVKWTFLCDDEFLISFSSQSRRFMMSDGKVSQQLNRALVEIPVHSTTGKHSWHILVLPLPCLDCKQTEQVHNHKSNLQLKCESTFFVCVWESKSFACCWAEAPTLKDLLASVDGNDRLEASAINSAGRERVHGEDRKSVSRYVNVLATFSC